MYLWDRPDWPSLTWNESSLSKLLLATSRQQGRWLGRMEALGFELRDDAHLHTLTEDVVESSEIEGEKLEREQVRSSIARRLGLDVGGLVPSDRNVDGVVELMLDATGGYDKPLTEQRLFAWHASLFPEGRSGTRKIEAPPAARVPHEMATFLDWFERPGDIDPLLKAGLAHLWFVTIHPFDDGNGRIARAIADMALSRSESSRRRFYSMSAQIRRERDEYYATLEATQKGDADVTRWQTWFLNCLLRAIEGAETTLGAVLLKARFWERFAKEPLNARQIAVLDKLLQGLEGKLTTSKWAKLAKCSQDTAHRDILDLVERGALKRDSGGGRSTSYSFCVGG